MAPRRGANDLPGHSAGPPSRRDAIVASRSANRASGTYEKRAAKKLVPITKAMEEGKEFLRSFGDLLQFHQEEERARRAEF